MQSSYDTETVAERENRMLLSISLGVGCLLLLCLFVGMTMLGLALFWTLQGNLGPGGQSFSAPTFAAQLASGIL